MSGSGRRRGWPDTKTPLLGQQHRSQSYSLEMSSSSSAISVTSRRCVFLGVDVGTGSARAGSLISYIPRIRVCEFVSF